MRKYFLAALMGLLLILGLGGSPALAASKPTPTVTKITIHLDGTATKTVNGKSVAMAPRAVTKSGLMQLTGENYRSKYICLQNNIGATWAIATASSWFESGLNTVVLENHGPTGAKCGDYYSSPDILAFGTVNDPVAANCAQLEIHTDIYGHYSQAVIIGMNVSSASAACRNTLQHRNNVVSGAMGYAFGEDYFYSSTSYGSASIMNNYYDNSYNYAGVDDRNTLYYVY